MKKIIKYILGVIIILAIAAVIVIIVRINKDYPEKSLHITAETYAYSDDGMYYIKNNLLYFLDNSSNKEVVVCNKANCKHDTEECNAYIYGMVYEMMYYDDKIYISNGYSDITFEDDEAIYDGGSFLTSIDSDGGHRKDIYTADSGAVLSMQGLDGVIYFTAYVFHNGFQLNTYNDDCSLYKYDLRWNKLECIKEYIAEEERDNASLTIAGIQNMDKIYLTYSYYTSDGTIKTSIMEFNIDTEEIKELRLIDDMISTVVTDDSKYIIYKCVEDEEQDRLVIMKCDDSFQDEEEILTAYDARVDILNGYMHVIKSDYSKILFDYENMDFYVANTEFTQEGTYISDIYNVDKEQNLIYIDATDYTGYMPGDLLPGDISSHTTLTWDSFLSENFVPYEDLSQEQKDEITWVDIQ